MTRAVLVVEAAGPLTTIQDAGRFGHLRHGVTWSGPVDGDGFAAAHAALGNVPGAAVELSHGRIVLRCVEGAVGFALCGGDFAATVDGVALGAWTTGSLHAGGRLVVRDGVRGNWATLAFAGQLVAATWLGSAATLALAGLGGGRLGVGDRLIVESAVVVEARPLPLPGVDEGPIRVVMGPQTGFFGAGSLAALVGEGFAIGAAFDRMGVVLAGPKLVPTSVTMLSAPLLRGAVQVNGEGTATILLADHQTTAGYPRIATVIGADLGRVAQLRPGAGLRFEAVTVGEAIALARKAAATRAGWLAAVGAAPVPLAERLMASNLIDGVVDAGCDGG